MNKHISYRQLNRAAGKIQDDLNTMQKILFAVCVDLYKINPDSEFFKPESRLLPEKFIEKVKSVK